MQTQKTLSVSKIAVIADYREREVIDSLRSLDAIVNETSLDVGDFVLSDGRVVIERKHHSDFVSSIIDGRVFQQCRLMKENFEKPIIIIEGYSNRSISENALKAAIAGLVVNYGVSLINTKNSVDTAKTIYWIAKKEQEVNKSGLAFKVGKKPKDERSMKEFVLSSFPGVSIKTARKILDEFGSIKNFLNADSIKLEKVVSKNKAQKIFDLINRKYSD